ncbi:MAG: HlyD family secretion protein [Bryobacteraceae bacterium]
MKRKVIYLIVFVLGFLASSLLMSWRDRPAIAAAPPAGPAASAPKPPLLIAPGRVEPVSEEIKVGSSIGGKLVSVPVEEGDAVRKGQAIGVLENDDFHARVAVAEAQVKQAEAALRRVVNGSRDQERREALAAVRAAEAVMENARAERERRAALFRSGDISRSDFDRAEREFAVAKARCDEARERHSFVDADARDDDRSRAEADVQYAQARLREALASLGRTIIRSPIDGVILRKHLRAGEAVPDGAEAPIVTLGDNRVLRVRAEIDESDVAKIRLGQQAYVTADAYGKTRFSGRVVKLGMLVGRRTSAPTGLPSASIPKYWKP